MPISLQFVSTPLPKEAARILLRANDAADAGDTATASALYDSALELCHRSGLTTTELASNLLKIAASCYNRGDYEGALRRVTTGKGMVDSSRDDKSASSLASFEHVRGSALLQLGKTTEATSALDSAAAEYERVEHSPPGLLFEVFVSLAEICRRTGSAAAGLEHLQRACVYLAPNEARTIQSGTVEECRGNLLMQLGRHAEALACYQTSLELVERISGTGSEEAVGCMARIAGIYHYTGQLSAAAAQHEACTTTMERQGWDNTLQYATANHNYGITLLEMGCCEQALERHRRSLEIKRRLLSRDHPDIAAALFCIVNCLRRSGGSAAAEEADDALA